ncbi:conserved Plasmodium protein, unknown function [Plasmodium relictum]|uniref:Uncharacterized protein n=1 Tax=Plasmodium relictum TaxID=85471 RepID=A0A1J1H3E5_PLARL|nr:conserved Plasmodium protein, unknown function [Plasmodium relictum]CRG99072.1 conserved Plasmodium protein, unknown function [Plasmodium relictum]
MNSSNILNKSKELIGIFLKYFKNDESSVKYLNECKNLDISEYYSVFYILYSDIINNDKDLVIYKDHLLFLSFCYMNKLLEKSYKIYSIEEKINIRNNFINILFSIALDYNHVIDNNILSLKEKSNNLIKKKFMEDFMNENNFILECYFNLKDKYLISNYMNSIRNKYSQILSILCMYNEYTYFRYLLNFITFFVCENLKRILSICDHKEKENNYTLNDNNNFQKINNDYFNTVLQISINFFKEIFYKISNENYSNVFNKQQLNNFRTIIINDINELFQFFSIVFYYCFHFNKKNEFELLIECIKELSFFLPAYIFFNESTSPAKFLLNLLLLYFRKNSCNCINDNNNYNGINNSTLSLNSFYKLYDRYLSIDELKYTIYINNFLQNKDIIENLLIIFLNIIEYISKINNKTFFQLNENELMQFLDNYFNIDLNFYDINNYEFQKIYIKMILNLSCIPISNYLHKRENKLKCLHIFIINIFKNIYHPNIKILINILTICKNIFDYNKDLIYIKNKDSEIESKIYNIYKTDKESLLNINNEKIFNNQFIITCDDFKKLFILMFIRFLKIPIYKENNSLNKKLLIEFVSNYVNQYNKEWFDTYYEYMKKYQNSYNNDNNNNNKNNNKHDLKQKIISLLKVLVALNHEVFHFIIEVFCDFFKFYDNINVTNLCNEMVKVHDYFIYVLVRAYYQLLKNFIEILKDSKRLVTGDNKEISTNVISYQISNLENEKSVRDIYIQNKINLRNSIENKIIELSSKEENNNMFNNYCSLNKNEMNSDNINNQNREELKKKKEHIDLELFIIKCIEKYNCSPYYEICNKCIVNLLNCYKVILQKDFVDFSKISLDFALFESKRLQFISETAYILNYNKDFAFFMMENLVKNITQNNSENSIELKKNYLDIFTSIIINLENFISNDMIEKILNTFLEYKKSTNIFKCNKEFCIFLLTLISILKEDCVNKKVIYVKLVLQDTYDFLTNFNKNITNFDRLYDLFYVNSNDNDKKIETSHSLFDIFKIIYSYFSLFSYYNIQHKIKSSKKESENYCYNQNKENSINMKERDIYQLMKNNISLINENEILQISINLFSNVFCIYSLFSYMINNNISFEKYTNCCLEASYFHLNQNDKEVFNLCNLNNKNSNKNSNNDFNNKNSIRKSNFTFKLLHENICNIIKRFIKEGYLFIYNDSIHILNNILSSSFSYMPFYYININTLSVYLCLSEQLKYLIYNKIINELIIQWYFQVFSQFFEKNFLYIREECEHIKKINSELSTKTNINEDDYVMYHDYLYNNKKYILNYLKICKNFFVTPNDFKNNNDKIFYQNIYNNNNNNNNNQNVLLDSFLSTMEYLLNYYDCDIIKKCLNSLVEISETIINLTFNSSHFHFYIQIIKIVLKVFLLYNPQILILSQYKEDKENNNIFNEYTEEKVEVYIGEMNLFMKNDPLELNSFLNIFTSALIRISKNYFLLQKNIFNINENMSFKELLNIDSVKIFLMLFQNIENSNSFNIEAIVTDLLKQNNSEYFKNVLIQYKLHKENKDNNTL